MGRRHTAIRMLLLASMVAGCAGTSPSPSGTATPVDSTGPGNQPAATAEATPASAAPVATVAPTPAPTPRPSPTAAPLPPNSVSGFIRDADGNPVAGAEVDLAWVAKDGNSGGGDTVTTDATGYYRTALNYGGPRPGQCYYLYVGANGGWLTFDGRGRWTVKNAPKVCLPLGDTPTLLDISLPATVPVSGKLVWANGKPAAGQWVEASSTSKGAGQTIGSTKTDKQGRFTLDLPPGKFVLWTTLSRSDPRFLTVTVKSRPLTGLVGRLPVNR